MHNIKYNEYENEIETLKSKLYQDNTPVKELD